jgi:hypothetical protein
MGAKWAKLFSWAAAKAYMQHNTDMGLGCGSEILRKTRLNVEPQLLQRERTLEKLSLELRDDDEVFLEETAHCGRNRLPHKPENK